MQAETRNCQNCKNQFTIEPDDFSFYETIHVPPPAWCPECRLIRRLSWQGYRMFYKRKCDFTGDEVITTHHPADEHKVYRQDVWWSDKWDPKEFGRDYDFSRSFFEQFQELMKAVPFPALYTEHSKMVNSDYCNAASQLKNCYLCFRITKGEESGYVNTIVDIKNCFDLSFSNFCELSYDSVRLNKCYQAFYSQDCDDCHDIWFSRDLAGCSNCIGCVNLRNKNYYIFNKPYPKEEYEKFFEELKLDSRKRVQEFKEKISMTALRYPRRQFHGRKNIEVTGDYVFNSKNVRDSYMLSNGENLRYCQFLKVGPTANCYDYSIFSDGAEWVYESCWVGLRAHNIKFSSWDYTVHDVEYSFGCHGSENLFGCVGIKNSAYCIFNKQYSKDKYKEIVDRIKRQMSKVPYIDQLGRGHGYGEFFPSALSPWAYNESTAYELFPLSKENALARGFRWRDPDSREYQDASIEVPDHIRDVSKTILKEILKCEKCGKNYQLIQKEFEFYKRYNIPIPVKCPLCRDRERIGLLNPMKIFERKCMKCGTAITTNYAPDRPEIVYCEQCYNAEVA